METPIKVAVIEQSWPRYMAFVTTDFTSLCDNSSKSEAIVEALENAGVIQVIDVTEERRKKREAERQAELMTLQPPPRQDASVTDGVEGTEVKCPF